MLYQDRFVLCFHNDALQYNAGYFFKFVEYYMCQFWALQTKMLVGILVSSCVNIKF